MRAIALLGVASILWTSAAAAQEPPAEPEAPAAPEPAPAAPAPAPAPAPMVSAPPAAEAPEPAAPVVRDHGVRLGVDLGYGRATSYASPDDYSRGSPSRIPIGLDLSTRLGPKSLLGIHGSYAIASRNNCIGSDSCTAHAIAFGGHLEAMFGSPGSFTPWFRYGVGVENLTQSGGRGVGVSNDASRWAFDLADMRLGGDFVIGRGDDGKATRIGPYGGLDAGVTTSSDTSGTGSGKTFAVLSLGVRATIDP